MHSPDSDGTEAGAAALPDRLVFAGFLLLIFLAPWPWGSNTVEARSLLGIAAGVLLAVCALTIGLGRIRPPALAAAARYALLVWILWLLWVGMQLLPLSPETLYELSPLSFEHHERLRALHAAPRYTLSIAPGQTTEALLDSLMLFCVYISGLLLIRTQRRVRWVLGTVFVAGCLQALYGIHMTVTGMEYGFLQPKTHGIGLATGTFVNRNHFAAYLVITAAAGIGLVLADLGKWALGSWRHFFGSVVDLLLSAKFRTRVLLAVIVVGVVMSRSRMGNIALVSAIAVAGTIYVLLRMRTSLIPALLVFTSIAAVDLLIVSRWFGFEQVIERIEETRIETEQRPLVLQDLVPAVEAYAWTGAGLGTFAQAYSPFRSDEVRGYYDHAHNEYAEFVIETGIPGLAILALFVAIHLTHAVRVMSRRRRSIYAGAAFAALMSSIAMLVHGTAEFMLRIPAVAVTWMVLLAVCASVSSTSRSRGQPESVISITSTN